MRTLIRTTWLVAAVAVGGAVAGAQAPATREALDRQIGRVFASADYAAPRFGPARWLPDGTAYAIVERSATGSEIVRYEAATGTRSVTVAASRLVPEGSTRGLEIEDYAWSGDGRRLLIFTNTRKVWRDNTRGDYWVLDLDGGRLRKLGGSVPEASLMFAKFSPDATRVAYVRANDIYVERLNDGKVTRLTTDGSETTINGTSDWVYEEELDVRDCFRWSPDGRAIAYWQFDTTGVGIFTLINNTDSLYPTLTKIPYPKTGSTNSAVRIGVVGAEGGATRWMRTPGDPRDTYLARLDWVDAQTLSIQHLNRLQNKLDVLEADAATGDVRRLFTDESKAWVDVQDLVWVESGKAFLWLSERDGWRHLYRVSRDGKSVSLVTRFDADVLDLVGVDSTQRVAYVRASPANATQLYLYRAPLDGDSAPVRVTPQGQVGWHAYTAAPGARMAFHTYSRFDQPPALDVVALPDHRSLRMLTDPSKLRAAVAPLVTSPVEFLTVDVGGATLDGWLLKPTNFDRSKRYPMVVYVYGEPANTTVKDQWGGGRMLFHRALAEAGYLVASFDNRGTPSLKGAAFRQAVYGAVGDLSVRDQADAVRALAKARPYVDPARVGIWGWSGGGSSTLHAMFRFPEVFAVGVAVAPMPDQTLYDTIYQERYMGLPQSNPDGYRRGSAIHFAAGLRGDLLIVHGTGDDNVHYQGSERLVNRLIELGKPFDTMVYPNRTHAISEGAGTTVHLYQLIARYFAEHLPAGGR